MNIALIGYGKMGKAIEQIAISRGHNIALIIDIDNAHDLNNEKLAKVDVAIEFSRPETAVANFLKCFEAKCPVVSGTTGWLDKLDEIKQTCINGNGSLFYASNFSVGVNIFFMLNKYLADIMNKFPNYNVKMEEVHHTQKLDAPSGTAITLAEDIFEKINRKDKWELNNESSPNVLQIDAVRRGEVPGIHTITYESEVDFIEITHNAKSRQGFALGAVLAAEYMNGKKTGFHGMNNMLTF